MRSTFSALRRRFLVAYGRVRVSRSKLEARKRDGNNRMERWERFFFPDIYQRRHLSTDRSVDREALLASPYYLTINDIAVHFFSKSASSVIQWNHFVYFFNLD